MQGARAGGLHVNTTGSRAQPFAQQRRSQRILLTVPIVVSGQRPDGSPFSERTQTQIVNAHGALIQLRERVLMNQTLRIKNIATNGEVSCTVVDLNQGSSEVREVGISFSEPAPSFWRVAFPPEDWTLRNPEAKRSSSKAGSNAPSPLPAKK
jgi:hypothetical protein